MTARSKTNRTPKSSRARNRRLARKQANKLNFEALEPRQLLAAVTVGNATDDFNAPDTSSITALMANDGGDGISLREAIAATNNTSGEDTITFASSLMGETITLGGSQLIVNDSVTIQGLGADQLTISGNNDSRIFSFGSVDAATYTIADITLTRGEVARGDEPSPQTGGAIRLVNPGDTLIIERSVISDSAANGGGAIVIGNGAELRISASALINNEANFSGSAILTGGTVDVEIVNSTISGNTSLNNGGALTVQTAGTESGSMTLRNVTVANNTGNGLVAIASTSSTSNFTIGNSILADNGNQNFVAVGPGTNFNLLGHNVFDNLIDPLLEPLANNGGPTPTHGLKPNSPAANMGSNELAVDADGNPLVTDQRGGGFTRIRSDVVDIGAFESNIEIPIEPPSFVVTTTLDTVDPTDFVISLREAIDFANTTSGENTITFDSNIFIGGDDNLIRLTEGELSISESLIINGISVGGVLITGDAIEDDVTIGDTNITDVGASFGGISGAADDRLKDNSRIFNFSSTTGDGLTLEGLTVTGGRTGNGSPNDVDGGGIRFDSNGNLTLINSILSGNSTGAGVYAANGDGRDSGDGGGIFTSSGAVTLTNSTLSGNSTGDGGDGDGPSFGGDGGDGGGIFSVSGTVTLTNSTLSGNSTGDGGSGNSGVDGDTGAGGGISTSSGTVTLTNSTLSGNSTGTGTGLASGYGGDGGGISTSSGDVSLVSSTLAGNLAFGLGGGVFVADTTANGSLTISNSIVAGNYANARPGNVNINDLTPDSQGVLTINYSLIGVADNLGTITGDIGNLTGTSAAPLDPLLSPLADNGSPNQTHALLTGSPAIDAGSDALAAGLVSDQRGFPFLRSFDDPTASGSAVDIGAFERQTVSPLVVDNRVDENDGDFSAGNLSLREAIGLINRNVGTDLITFDGSVFTGGDASVIRLTQGELLINESLSIDGSSVGGVLITGDADDDDITVSDTDITDAGASFGGNSGATDDLLDDNSRVLSFSGSGNLTITSLTITGGRRTGTFLDGNDGGGILFDSDGALSLYNSTVSGNSTTVPSTTRSSTTGGGISTRSGNVSLFDSTVSGNSAFLGGGIYNGFGNVSLFNSTISGNTSGGDGGGIYNYTGNVSLFNSTISGNSSGGDGGGIYFDNSTVLIVNSTITGNSSSTVGGGLSALPNGDESLTLRNSIVAGNTDNGVAPDVEFAGGNMVVENSLIGDTTGSGITSATGAGNILDQAALLGPLANNGGQTQTHALLPGSPAIDAGSNALAVDQGGNALTSDQRGEDRIAFGTVDIGAYELQSLAIGPRVASTVRDEGGVLARPDLLNTFVVRFDQDVDIDAGDLSIRNDTLGSLVDTSGVSFSYDADTFNATWDFSGLVLDAAFFTFELSDTITGVVSGLALDGNSDGTVGGNYMEEVYVAIPGDANLDGRVDVLGDAFILIGNLGTTTNLAFADGNFNGDGLVDVLGDAFILINNLGSDVRPPMLALSSSNVQQLSSASSAEPSNVALSIDQSSVILPADLDKQDHATSTGLISAASEQLVLAGDHDLRDDVFGSEF